MKNIQHCIMALVLASLSMATAWAGDFKIIAHPSVSGSSVSADDLKSVFLQEKNALGSSSVEPVLLKSGPAHESFLKEIVGKTDSALQTYYRSLIFTGKGSMPKTLKTDAEVAAYVAKNKGAIGYVSNSAGTDGAKVLAVQ